MGRPAWFVSNHFSAPRTNTIRLAGAAAAKTRTVSTGNLRRLSSVVRTHEREITQPVALCEPDGWRLNPAAVGWSRTPLHRANLAGWGRTKRWEYWCVQAPDFALAMTVSSIDYLALHSLWFTNFADVEFDDTKIVPLGTVALPPTSGGAAVGVTSGSLRIQITPSVDGVRLEAQSDRVAADIALQRTAGHESLAVVIPWTPTRFQYTVKENTLRASGHVTAGGHTYALDPQSSFGVLDHGRGRWPYRTKWNWGSGSGVSDGHLVGLQFGGKWTDGTGMTENALCLDGRLHKLGSDLRWEYDTKDWLRSWRVIDPAGRVDLTFTPRFNRAAQTEVLVIGTSVNQCFGAWSGFVVDDDGTRVDVRDVRGFAEEAHMRW